MKLHKLSLIAALALGSLLVCTNFSSAQDAKEGKKRGGLAPQQRAERLATELNLTADQKTKVTALFEEETKKIQELRADTSVPREQRREKGQAIREDSNKKLKVILTNEQWEKWQKMRDEMRNRAIEKKAEKKDAKDK